MEFHCQPVWSDIPTYLLMMYSLTYLHSGDRGASENTLGDERYETKKAASDMNTLM